MNADIIVKAIIQQGMLPLFYHDSEEISLDIVKTLYQAGVRVIEYTNRGNFALSNFKKIKEIRDREMQDLYLGIGTVKVKSEAESYIEAGADFIVAPIINPVVATVASSNNIPWFPGCMTPSEINQAQSYHAKLIKIFPANILGPEFIASIKDLFPGQLFMPTGGVSIDENNLKTWFESGVCAVGMGSKLISKEILEKKDYETLTQKTKLALSMLAKVKP